VQVDSPSGNSSSVAFTVTARDYTFAQKVTDGATDYYYQKGGNLIQQNSGGSISWRNNNPGNITYVGQNSAIGSYFDTAVDLTFAIFPRYTAGVRAAEQLLKGSLYSGDGLSIDAAIKRWTNDSGRALRNYESIVESALGLPGSTLVSALTEAQLHTMVISGIRVAEGWNVGTSTYPNRDQANIALLTNYISQFGPAEASNTINHPHTGNLQQGDFLAATHHS
jgi:hypothetical protein